MSTTPTFDGSKSLGERLYEAWSECQWDGRTIPFAELISVSQATWERTAVNFAARLSDADALSDRDARIAELEGGFRIIAEGTVSSGQNGHYLAHRYAVKIARALLTPTGTEIKDE